MAQNSENFSRIVVQEVQNLSQSLWMQLQKMPHIALPLYMYVWDYVPCTEGCAEVVV